MLGVVARISLRKRKCHVIFRAFSFKFHWGVSRSLRNCRKDVIIWIRGNLRLLLVFRSLSVRLLLNWLLRIFLMRNIDGIILIFFFSLLYQFCCLLRTFDRVFDEFRVSCLRWKQSGSSTFSLMRSYVFFFWFFIIILICWQSINQLQLSFLSTCFSFMV